jgi:3-oxoadipate enol-lactonase
MWRGQAAALARRHRVLNLDLRGYGESELPERAFAHHDDVVGLLDALRIERAALVGCSSGGKVAIDTTLAHPDRVCALALFGSAVSGYKWSDDSNEAALGNIAVRELDPPAIGRLGEIGVPVLVGAGAADVPDVSRLADHIAAQVPGAIRLPDVPDAGHLLPLEHPAQVNEALLAFLS